jgi:hypothetical protein
LLDYAFKIYILKKFSNLVPAYMRKEIFINFSNERRIFYIETKLLIKREVFYLSKLIKVKKQ